MKDDEKVEFRMVLVLDSEDRRSALGRIHVAIEQSCEVWQQDEREQSWCKNAEALKLCKTHN